MIDPKIDLRPFIPSIEVKKQTSQEERFQNKVIRPIIKLQHELIIAYFKHFIDQKKIVLNDFCDQKITEFISKLFKTNASLKTNLKGLIIGMFTIAEFNVYLTMSSQLNKRITSILEARVISVYLTHQNI
ncbi:hypothetical protein OAH12_00315 [Cyclobacteriaceae bacterium]|nr:hypothetical protein [Cyclobacteriaceae bacterium]